MTESVFLLTEAVFFDTENSVISNIVKIRLHFVKMLLLEVDDGILKIGMGCPENRSSKNRVQNTSEKQRFALNGTGKLPG
ncbi:hypothetical protein ACX0G9_27370 [Flavitalea flava]